MGKYDKELEHQRGFNGVRLSPVDQIWYGLRDSDDYPVHILLDKHDQPTLNDEGEVGLPIFPSSDPWDRDLAGKTAHRG